MIVRIQSRTDEELAEAIRRYHSAGGAPLATRFLNAFDAAVAAGSRPTRSRSGLL